MRSINLQFSDFEHKKIEELKVKFRLKNKSETVRKIVRLFHIDFEEVNRGN